MKKSLIILVVGFLGGIASGGPIEVVCEGDSHTLGYTRLHEYDETWRRIRPCFEVRTPECWVDVVAEGGTRTYTHLGLRSDGVTVDPNGHDYVADVLGYDPDIIVVMLGANNIGDMLNSDLSVSQDDVDVYHATLSAIYDEYDGYVNGRGRAPIVCAVKTIPRLMDSPNPDRQAALNDLIVTHVNPFIESEAGSRGYPIFDAYAFIQSQPNWESLYNSEGVHLTAEGSTLLANAVADFVIDQTVNLPEPTSLVFLLGGVVVALGRRK